MPSRLVRRYKNRRKHKERESSGSSRSNPPLLQDLAEFVLPGFAGFAASRLATRIAATQVAQRKPEWGKHAGGLTAVGAFFAAWFLAHRWKPLEKYHTPIVVGAAIAALQSLIQLYIPRLGWMVADATPDMTSPQLATGGQQMTASQQLPAGYTASNEDPNMFVYDDRYDAGRMSTPQQTMPQQSQTPDATAGLDELDGLEIGEDDLQHMGVG